MRLSGQDSVPEGNTAWDPVWKEGRYRQFDRRIRRALRRLRLTGLLQDLTGSARLLDVGCGGGENLFCISQRVATRVDLAGIDVSPAAVARAATLLQNRAKVETASGCELPFGESSFTHVTMFGVMEHIRGVDALINEASRVLASRGKLYITTSNKYSMVSLTTRLRKVLNLFPYGYQRDWTEFQIRQFLLPHFKQLSIKAAGPDWDMPLAKLVDAALQGLYPMWGRYLIIEATK